MCLLCSITSPISLPLALNDAIYLRRVMLDSHDTRTSREPVPSSSAIVNLTISLHRTDRVLTLLASRLEVSEPSRVKLGTLECERRVQTI